MSQVDPPVASLPNPLVRKLEGFTTLSDADRTLLERISAESRYVGPHTDLVREGDKPDGVLLVMEGIACRHKHRANGARQIMAYLVPGDLGDLDVALLKKMDHTIKLAASASFNYVAVADRLTATETAGTVAAGLSTTHQLERVERRSVRRCLALRPPGRRDGRLARSGRPGRGVARHLVDRSIGRRRPIRWRAPR